MHTSSVLEKKNYLLSLAAMFEDEFSLDWMIELTGLKASEIVILLEQEIESGLIGRTKPAFYIFSNGQRLKWTDALEQSQKDLYHRLISEILIRELPDDEKKSPAVARHLIHLTNDVQACRWVLQAGRFYAQNFDHKKAADCFSRVLRDLANKRGKNEDLLFIQTAIAHSDNLARTNDDFPVHLAYLHEASSRAMGLNNRALILLLEMHIAKYERLTSDFNKSIERFQRASVEIDSIGDSEIRAAANILRSYFMFWQGRFPEVIESYENSAPDVHKLPLGYFPILAAITVGHSYTIVGQVTQGLGMLDSLRNYCLTRGDSYLAAQASHAIAIAMLSINRMTDALHYARLSFKEADQSRNIRVKKTLALVLALILNRQKNKKESRHYLNIFFEIKSDECNNFLLLPYLLEAGWLSEKGEFDSIPEHDIAAEINRTLMLDNYYVKGLAYRYQAMLAIKQKRPERDIARSFLLSTKWLKKSGNRIEHAMTCFEQTRHYLTIEKTQSAEKTMEAAIGFMNPADVSLIPDDLRPLMKNRDFDVTILGEILNLADRKARPQDHKKLLPQILAVANRVTGAERGALLIIDEASPSNLLLRASKNFSQDQIETASFADSRKMIAEVIATGEGLILKSASSGELPTIVEIRSGICVPLLDQNQTIGVLYHDNRLLANVFKETDLNLLSFFATLACLELAREKAESKLKMLQEDQQFVPIKNESIPTSGFPGLVGKSPALLHILNQIEKVAPTDTAVLIYGETGVGKELIARAIHKMSRRSDKPLIKVNCAALPPSLIESELFGHEKGAFTGADSKRVGRFELAQGATLFLDEIGEFPMELQPKLLRVLQEGEFERVGGSITRHVDVRLIVATNRDLASAIEAGRFRSDLWYRLNAFPISIPPLRERREDINLLIDFFIAKYSDKSGKCFKDVSVKTLDMLQSYKWPGNVRELENMVERAVISSSGKKLILEVPSSAPESKEKIKTLKETEREHILKVLNSTYWKIDGPYGAARLLGLNPSTLRHRIKKLELQRPSTIGDS